MEPALFRVAYSPIWARRIKWTIGVLVFGFLVLVGIGIIMGDVGFFLRWFIGLESDT